jgi:4-amino-4-deoxy-L-arabinose transferase-like glycosyltransferase
MTRILLVVLIFAAMLRVIGVYPGYHPNHSDEVNIYSQAVNILKTGSLDELRFEYPPLPAYINFLSFKYIFIPISWERFYLENLGQVFDGTLPLKLTPLAYNSMLQLKILGDRDINAMFWARTVTAIIGVGIVFLIFKIGEDLFDSKAGLISAFLVAINYRQVLNSHFGLPDVYNAFFLALAFYMIVRVWKKPDFKNYILASVACGLAFATKYQFFSFIPFFIVHIFITNEKNGFRNKFKFLLNPRSLSVPFIIVLAFMILNPYFFIHLDVAREQLAYAALKYRFGKNFLDFYPLSYLFNYGIGRLTSILILFGVSLTLFKNFKKGFLLLSTIIPVFYYLIFMTGGGFYTRNFVTITPLVLIFAGYFMSKMLNLKFKYLGYFVFIVLILSTAFENLNKDFILLDNYTKSWNQDIFKSWIENNISNDSKIAAHSSVPLPDSYRGRLDYDFYPAFSIDEFIEEGAKYAIANYEWETNDFYWWMTQDTRRSLQNWIKPTSILKETYPGMALTELQDFGIYSLVKPAFAPDANYLVSKIPQYQISNANLIKEFDFKGGKNDWTSVSDSSFYENGNLIIKKGGTPDSYTRWISPEVKINTSGFKIEYKIETIENVSKREGFLFVKFYKNNTEIGERLSKRNDIYNKWVNDFFVGQIPPGTDYMKVGFQVYNTAVAEVRLSDVKVYGTNVVNKNSEGIKHIEIPEDILFPTSQGNM